MRAGPPFPGPPEPREASSAADPPAHIYLNMGDASGIVCPYCSTLFRRTDRLTLRMIGPITKPMNRSMPVHSTPQMTWTKLRNQ